MIALLLLISMLAELPPQPMAPGQCLTFLWSRTEPPRRVAMIDERAGILRIMHDGKPLDLARTAPGAYAAGPLQARVDLQLQTHPDVTDARIVEQGTLRLEAPGEDMLLLSVGGLSGCAPGR